MNWLDKLKISYYKKWLILIPVSAIFVVSCENPDEIGLGLSDDQSLARSVYVDTVTIRSYTAIANEPVITDGTNVLLVGSVSDEFVGDITCTPYFRILPEISQPSFGTGVTIQSATLQFEYAATDYFYGDTTIVPNWQVYSLADSINNLKLYVSSDEISFNVPSIGSVESGLTPNPRGTGLVRFNIDNNFALELLNAAAGKTNQEFLQIIKGLAIEPVFSDASVIGLSPSSENTYLRIQYSNDQNPFNTFDFKLGSTARRFNHIEAERSGTPVDGLSQAGDSVSSTAVGNRTFIQSGLPLYTRISFPYFEAMMDTLKNAAIDKAELVIPIISGSTTGSGEAPPPVIYLVETTDLVNFSRTASGQSKIVQLDLADVNGVDNSQLVSYNEVEQKYTINMTSYIRALSNGTKENKDFFIVPFLNSTRINRAVLADNFLADPSRKLKLNIYYSKLEE